MSVRKVTFGLFSHLFSSHYFHRWRKLVAIVQGTRENPYFPRLTLLLPLSYQTTASAVHKSVRASLICLGLTLTGCREIFSS